MSASGSALGSRLAGAGGCTAAAGSTVRQPLTHRELVEAPHRHNRPGGRAGTERPMVRVPLPQGHQEAGDGAPR